MTGQRPSTPGAEGMPPATDSHALTYYLRRQGLSCLRVAGPGTLRTWGLIYLADRDDLTRADLLLDQHAQITALAESVNRTEEGWPLWYRVRATAIPIMGTPRQGSPGRRR